MNKQDLKTGMIVELYDGSKFLVILGKYETAEGVHKNVLLGTRGSITIDLLDWDEVYKVYRLPHLEGTFRLFNNLESRGECIYKKPKVNWEEITVDTKLKVYRQDGSVYYRYFSHYDPTHEIVFFFPNGSTSFSWDTANDHESVHAKYAEVVE